MPKTMKGPAIFLAQFAGDAAPFNSLKWITKWAAGLGYKGVQTRPGTAACSTSKKAAGSKAYCDEVKGICAEAGVEITELSTHLQGQLVAVHPAYDAQFDGFAPASVHNNPKARQKWAVEQMKFGAKASRNLGLDVSVTFSGALAFPYLYPWPQRPAGLIEEAFAELAKRWKPILDAYDDVGVDVGYEIHPGEDLFDGTTFEMFLDAVGGHGEPTSTTTVALPAAAARLSRLHRHLSRAHKSLPREGREFNPDGRQGVYSGYQGWVNRAGRFRSLGDGQVDFSGIFQARAIRLDSWAVLEWECCLKHPEDGAAEGAPSSPAIIRVTEKAFNDFAGGATDKKLLRKMGIWGAGNR